MSFFLRFVIRNDTPGPAISDNGFRKKDADSANMRYCDHGEWNERYMIERMLSRITEIFHVKKISHRTVHGIHMRIGATAAAFYILLK